MAHDNFETLKQKILTRYPRWEDFMKEQNPVQLCVNYSDIMRLHDVYLATPITMEFLTKIYPMQNQLAGSVYLQQWLFELNRFLNINKSLTNDMIQRLAYMLYTRYSMLKLADLKLLFDFIIESRYGTFYGSVDTQRIASSFVDYKNERNKIFMQIEEHLKKEAEERRKQEESMRYEEYRKTPQYKKNMEEIQRLLDINLGRVKQ